MPAFAETSVLPEATPVGALSALLRTFRLGIPGEHGVDNGDIFYSLRIAVVDPWTCMPKHSNPQRDMLEHPIFALPEQSHLPIFGP